LGQPGGTGLSASACRCHSDARCCGSGSTEELELLLGEHDDQGHYGSFLGRRCVWMSCLLCRQEETLKLSRLSEIVAAFTGQDKVAQ